MSACISRHGEFSEHNYAVTGPERFMCTRCCTFAENALVGALAAAESALRELCRLLDETDDMTPSMLLRRSIRTVLDESEISPVMPTPTIAELDECERLWTRSEATARGLYVAEGSLGDQVVRAYGRTEAEAAKRVDAKRDELARLYMFGPSRLPGLLSRP